MRVMPGKSILFSLLLIFVLGCQINGADKVSNKEDMDRISPDRPTTNKQVSTEVNDSPKVAPIFLYGVGKATIACFPISAPAFLTEEEAKRIIEAEFKKEGIVFNRRDHRIKDIKLEKLAINGKTKNPFEKRSKSPFGIKEFDYETVAIDYLVFDGYNADLNLGYEFISKKDAKRIGVSGKRGTSEKYETISDARLLRSKLFEYGKVNSFIFYDPLEPYDSSPNRINLKESVKVINLPDSVEIHIFEKKSSSKEQLRKQVKSSIKWYKQNVSGKLTEDEG